MLSNRIRTKEINGKEFQIYMLKAGVGIKVAKKLSTVVAAMFSNSGEGDEITIDFANLSKSLTEVLSDEDLDIMVGVLLKELSIDGKEVNFDDYFCANYGELVEVMAFALQENFGSFFEGKGILAL